jgi:hypothetical protein
MSETTMLIGASIAMEVHSSKLLADALKEKSKLAAELVREGDLLRKHEEDIVNETVRIARQVVQNDPLLNRMNDVEATVLIENVLLMGASIGIERHGSKLLAMELMKRANATAPLRGTIEGDHAPHVSDERQTGDSEIVDQGKREGGPSASERKFGPDSIVRDEHGFTWNEKAGQGGWAEAGASKRDDPNSGPEPSISLQLTRSQLERIRGELRVAGRYSSSAQDAIDDLTFAEMSAKRQ